MRIPAVTSSLAALVAALVAAVRGFESDIPIDNLCKGYSLSNLFWTSCGIQADLDLIGEGCDVYGPDVPRLKLEVDDKCQPGRDPLSPRRP